MQRRELFKGVAGGLGMGIAGVLAGRTAGAAQARSLEVAGYVYDRVPAIADGHTGIEGADVSFHERDIYALNRSAFGPEPTFDITEVGLIPYVAKFINEGFREYALIPIFISRTFRHRNVFVRTNGGIEKPEDLRGKKVAVPGYGSSANTWIRGFLLDDYGLAPGELEWIETTKSSDDAVMAKGGFTSTDEKKSRYFLPPDFPLAKGPPGVDESQMLLEGLADAVIAPITPKAFLEGDPRIRRLFPDVRAAERAYYEKTGVFPIMHAVGIRKSVIEANPEIPKAAFEMYGEAKKAAYAKLEGSTSLKVTLPWVTQEFEETRALMGDDYWPYGIERNQKELELVMRYVHEQGLVKERIGYEDLFHPSTLTLDET